MARYIALTARPRASAAPAAGKLQLTRAPAQASRRQKASTRPNAQIQQEVQDVVESVLGACVALDVPLMQVRFLVPLQHWLTASWSGESDIERVMTKGYHVSCVRHTGSFHIWVSLDLPLLHILWQDKHGISFCE